MSNSLVLMSSSFIAFNSQIERSLHQDVGEGISPNCQGTTLSSIVPPTPVFTGTDEGGVSSEKVDSSLKVAHGAVKTVNII